MNHLGKPSSERVRVSKIRLVSFIITIIEVIIMKQRDTFFFPSTKMTNKIDKS